MKKEKNLFEKWHIEYVVDGYQDDILSELKSLKTINQAQDLIAQNLEEAGVQNYDKIEALYNTALTDFANAENPKQMREIFGNTFGQEVMEDSECFLDMLSDWLLYDEEGATKEDIDDNIEIMAQGLFVVAQNINHIIDKIKTLEYEDVSYVGPKVSDFDNKAQYITYIMDKKLANENANDYSANVVVLVDEEIKEQNQNIIDYFKNKHSYRQTDNDNNENELTLSI